MEFIEETNPQKQLFKRRPELQSRGNYNSVIKNENNKLKRLVQLFNNKKSETSIKKSRIQPSKISAGAFSNRGNVKNENGHNQIVYNKSTYPFDPSSGKNNRNGTRVEITISHKYNIISISKGVNHVTTFKNAPNLFSIEMT